MKHVMSAAYAALLSGCCPPTHLKALGQFVTNSGPREEGYLPVTQIHTPFTLKNQPVEEWAGFSTFSQLNLSGVEWWDLPPVLKGSSFPRVLQTLGSMTRSD